MRLFDFLRKESPESWRLIFIMAITCGIANGVLLGIINTGSAMASEKAVSVRWLLLFLIAMAIFIVAKKVSLSKAILVAERALKNLRVRISGKIRHSDLIVLENLSKGEIYTKLSQDAGLISQSAFVIINAAQESIMLVFCLLYLAWLSKVAFTITVVAVSVAVFVYYNHRKTVMEDLKVLAGREAQLLDSMGHIISGFKEIKLNLAKSDSLFASFTELANGTEELKVKTETKFITDIMFSSVFFYFLLASVVFLLPRMMPTYSDVVLKSTAVILFIIGPLQMIVGAAPVLARANASLSGLYDLEERLDASMQEKDFGKDEVPRHLFRNFQNISLKGVHFSYLDSAGQADFSVGPLDLEVGRGEVIFLVGGNGCGKSTLLKLLAGLYVPSSGSIKVDNRLLHNSNIQPYRELFAAIFGDFHLFDRLYGMENVDYERVASLIHDMEIEDKTQFVGGRFTHLNLSTGQRKRLALISALLEDREIYVFDEWAADQDPVFRKRFYEEIIPALKRQGKTVLAVTHDDRYWERADTLIKMEYGKIVEKTDKNRNRTLSHGNDKY
jgi:putative pyoverdin transport system ATP-binding/permease protein